jgi:hypothetical protein
LVACLVGAVALATVPPLPIGGTLLPSVSEPDLASLAHAAAAIGQARLGAGYGDVWIDPARDRVHVDIAGPLEDARTVLNRELPRHGAVELDRVRHSRQELLTLQRRLDSDRDVLAATGVDVVSDGPDYTAGELSVGVADASPAVVAALEDRYGSGILTVHGAVVPEALDAVVTIPSGSGPPVLSPPPSSAPAPVPTVTPSAAPGPLPPSPTPSGPAPRPPDRLDPPDRADVPAIVAGGQNVVERLADGRTTLCTIGYVTEDVRRQAFYALSAGHCFLDVIGDVYQLDRDGVKRVLGPVVADTDVASPGRPAQADAGLALLSAGAVRASGLVVTADGRELTVTGITDPVVGESVCKSGVKTGETCGTVTATEVTETFHMTPGDAGVAVQHVVQFRGLPGQAMCDHGDSGGPVYRELGQTAIAEGTLIGGPNGDHTLCEFSSLSESLAALRERQIDLSLVAAISQAPVPAPIDPGPAVATAA